ncbi:MAG: metallophosphoesterase [Syntrophobacteraceae bacterium]|nr:metallophosphoesterase [Desulfobacteraceae bacterium]
MTTFLIVFFAIYTCIHAVFFIRVRSLLPAGWPWQLAFGAFLLLMILAPIGIRLLERGGFDAPARFAAFAGYGWMGFVALCFCAFVADGIVDGVFKLVGLLAKIPVPALSGNAATVSLLLAVLGVCVYGFFDARDIRVERVVLKTGKLPAGVDHLRIVQVSDLHMGLIVRGERLQKVVEIVRGVSPDVIVSTGDLVDGSVGNVEELIRIFEPVSARYGKYAVVGNHEYYAGIRYALEITKRLGFKVIQNGATDVRGLIDIAGVDDPVGGGADEEALLRSVRNGRFVLFLKHRPEPLENCLGLFDLQLSGHTHRGQVFPFSLVTARVYPLQDGLYELARGSMLYTSRGTGTWGPPMRVLSPPEVTVIDLMRE